MASAKAAETGSAHAIWLRGEDDDRCPLCRRALDSSLGVERCSSCFWSPPVDKDCLVLTVEPKFSSATDVPVDLTHCVANRFVCALGASKGTRCLDVFSLLKNRLIKGRTRGDGRKYDLVRRVGAHDWHRVGLFTRAVASHSASTDARVARPTEVNFVDYYLQHESNPGVRGHLCLGTRFSALVERAEILQILQPFVQAFVGRIVTVPAEPRALEALRGRLFVSGRLYAAFPACLLEKFQQYLPAIFREAARDLQCPRLHHVSFHLDLDRLSLDIVGLPGRLLRVVLLQDRAAEARLSELLDSGSAYLLSGQEQLNSRAAGAAESLAERGQLQLWTGVFREPPMELRRSWSTLLFPRVQNGGAARVQYTGKNEGVAAILPPRGELPLRSQAAYTAPSGLFAGTLQANRYNLWLGPDRAEDLPGLLVTVSFGPAQGMNHEDSLPFFRRYPQCGAAKEFYRRLPTKLLPASAWDDAARGGRRLHASGVALGPVRKNEAIAFGGLARPTAVSAPLDGSVSELLFEPGAKLPSVAIIRSPVEFGEGDKFFTWWQKFTAALVRHPPLLGWGLPVRAALHEASLSSRLCPGLLVQALTRLWRWRKRSFPSLDAFAGDDEPFAHCDQSFLRREALAAGCQLQQAVYDCFGRPLRHRQLCLPLFIYPLLKHHPKTVATSSAFGSSAAGIEPIADLVLQGLHGHPSSRYGRPHEVLTGHENSSVAVCSRCFKTHCECPGACECVGQCACRAKRFRLLLPEKSSMLLSLLQAQGVSATLEPGRSVMSSLSKDERSEATTTGRAPDPERLRRRAAALREDYAPLSLRAGDMLGADKLLGTAAPLVLRAMAQLDLAAVLADGHFATRREDWKECLLGGLCAFRLWCGQGREREEEEVAIPPEVPEAIVLLCGVYASTDMPVKFATVDQKNYASQGMDCDMLVPANGAAASVKQGRLRCDEETLRWAKFAWTPELLEGQLRAVPVSSGIPEGRHLFYANALSTAPFLYSDDFRLNSPHGTVALSPRRAMLGPNIRLRGPLSLVVKTAHPSEAGRAALSTFQVRRSWAVRRAVGREDHLARVLPSTVCPEGVSFQDFDVEDAHRRCTGCGNCVEYLNAVDEPGLLVVEPVASALRFRAESSEETGVWAALLRAGIMLERELRDL